MWIVWTSAHKVSLMKWKYAVMNDWMSERVNEVSEQTSVWTNEWANCSYGHGYSSYHDMSMKAKLHVIQHLGEPSTTEAWENQLILSTNSGKRGVAFTAELGQLWCDIRSSGLKRSHNMQPFHLINLIHSSFTTSSSYFTQHIIS